MKDLVNVLAIVAIIGYLYQSGFRVTKTEPETLSEGQLQGQTPGTLDSLLSEVNNLRQTVDLVNEIKSLRSSVQGMDGDPVAKAKKLVEVELLEETPEQVALDMEMEEKDSLSDRELASDNGEDDEYEGKKKGEDEDEEEEEEEEGKKGEDEEDGEKEASASGDPHFSTWKGEHFEYHGQCDMVMASDSKFADGLGLDVHLRTKVVRFWSYIKNVGIRIGNDVLEIEGSPDPEDRSMHYWYNFEYQGELDGMGGFPITANTNGVHKRFYEIDLSSKYPGQKIILSSYKEFLRVNFQNGNEDSFGNCIGILGDYKSGKTLSRDGVSVIDDFVELGEEWQVHPHEPMLFHRNEEPVFPQKCIEPEDPRGDRRRRLDESSITEEQAEKACAHLDALSRKDCVYDILATQDIGMVGAY